MTPIKLIDLSTLTGPPIKPTRPGDCPGYGRELPQIGWECYPQCPIGKQCYETFYETLENAKEKSKK
jgi:hypothetical protein